MKVLLLDGTGLAYRSYYAFVRHPLRTSRGEETSLTFAFVNTLLKLLERKTPERACIVFDAPGPTFRHLLDTEYKAGRPAMPDSMRAQLPRLHEMLDAFRLPRLQIPGVEADDVLGTLARRFETQGAQVVLVTSDKDFQQLLSDSIHLLRWRRTPGDLEEFGPEELHAALGLQPEQVVDYLALCGDTVDNVPGVPGVGEKTARQLIAAHGSLDALYAHLEQVPSAALRRKLEAGRQSAVQSRELLRLVTDVPLELDPATLVWEEPDWPRLRALLRELEFFQLLRQLPAAPRGSTAPPELHAVDDAAGLAAMAQALAAAPSLALLPELEAGSGRLRALGLAPAPDTAFVLRLADSSGQLPLGGLGLLPGPEAGWSWEALRPVLGPVLARSDLCKVGHDLKSVAVQLEPAALALAPPWFDTMVAAYVLEPSRAAPALETLAAQHLDTHLESTAGSASARLELLQRLGRRAVALRRLVEPLSERLTAEHLLPLFETVEMPLAAVLLDMERCGVKVDEKRLRELSRELEAKSEALAEAIYRAAGRRFNLHSPRQLGEVLFDDLKLPHGRRTRTGWSTDGDVLERLAEEHELPRQVLEFRQLTKLHSTYTEALPRLVHPRTGRIHTRFNQTVASTGRLSSSDPNLQNIPTRSEWGRRIRAAFVPEAPDGRLLSADYSQVELRIMAHLSQDRALLQAFRSGGDVHTLTAARIAGCAPEAVTPAQRAAAKTVNFGVLYGMGARGLSQQLGIEVEEARRFIDEYFASYPGVRAYTQEMVQRARAQGHVTTLLGRKLSLPDLQSAHPGQRAFAERVAVNAPIQGSAADLIKTAMVRVHRRLQAGGGRARMILQVHDELLFEVPEAEVESVAALARHEMEHALPLSVPLVVEIGSGRNWAEAH